MAVQLVSLVQSLQIFVYEVFGWFEGGRLESTKHGVRGAADYSIP